jgi:hypothetical protein
MTKKIFVKNKGDHPQRVAKIAVAEATGVAVVIERNTDGTLYQVPAEEYRRLMKVKRYHHNTGWKPTMRASC